MTEEIKTTIYAIAYARVSTKDHEQNPESQLVAIRQWAKAKGNIEIVAEFQDKITGKTDAREDLDRIFGFKRRHPEVTKLLILDTDRLSRDIQDTNRLIEDLQGIGLEIVFITNDKLDLNTSQGLLINTVNSFAAQVYVEGLPEKIKAGQERARLEGKHIGRPLLREDSIDVKMLLEFAKQGLSLRKLEKIYNCSRNTLVRRMKKEGVYDEFMQIQGRCPSQDQ